MSSPTSTHDSSSVGHKSFSFWVTFLCLCLSLSLFALELTSVSTSLPTIVEALHVSEYVWVAASYALASMACIPLTGNTAQVFGRKPTLVAAVIIFAVGSALCGAAQNPAMLLVGRTVQGFGGGSINTLSNILLGDLVPLRERGTYYGLWGLYVDCATFISCLELTLEFRTWSIACGIGPVVGGALASAGQWRWLFYLNLPISGLCLLVFVFFLRLRSPRENFMKKVKRLDYIGIIISMGASAGIAIALAWGGVQFAWGSANVLAPLILGVAGLVFFIIYEKVLAREPILPFILLSNQTSISGYTQSVLSAIVALAGTYFIPVYYQACKGASPIHSGIQTLGFAVIAPAAVIGGILVKRSQKYRPYLWIGWCLMVVGSGLMATVEATTPTGHVIGFTAIIGFGLGWVYALVQFPIQAPLPVGINAQCMALLALTRAFGSIWGVSIGNTVLQNILQHRLPQEFLSEVATGIPIVYALIPTISSLPPTLKDQVRMAFADGLQLLWRILLGISALGFASSLLMLEHPLIGVVDETWGMQDGIRKDSENKETDTVLLSSVFKV